MAATLEISCTRTKTFPCANLSKTNRAWTDPVSSPSLHFGRAEIED